MTDDIREYVSVLADGEAHGTKLHAMLDRLEQDPELRQHWECYHLISDALKNHLPSTLDREFARRVMIALDGESRVKIPFLIWRPPLRPTFRDAVGFAMAASVAAVAILATQWATQRPGGEVNQPSLGSLPVQYGTAPLPTAQPTPPPITVSDAHPDTRQTPESGAADERLNNYLIDHSVYAAASGMQGMMPYVRVVGYGYK
jgi:sigma-E factor negative regulatory protein RseA